MAGQDDLIESDKVVASSASTQSSSGKDELPPSTPSTAAPKQEFSLLSTDSPPPPPPTDDRFRAKTQAPNHLHPPTPDFMLSHPTSTAAKKPVLDIKEIGLAFRGRLEDLPEPPKLSFSTAAIAMFVCLLPALYMVIVGSVAYTTAVFALDEFEHALYSMSLSQIVTYLTWVVIGSGAVAFLMKPVLARPVDDARPIVLDPRREPYITEFVHQIAQTVGAPVPSSIQVDCDVRVAAGFHSGLLSMVQNKLILRIGMPVMCGCNLRQLAALITHGLVHFDQSPRMRLHYLVRDINAWFERAATRRDAIDIAFDDRAIGSFTARAVRPAWRGASSLVRKLLALFRLAGRFFSGNLLREMEGVADRYAALIAGTEAYTDTITRLKELQFAYERAAKQIPVFHQKRHLVDDFPHFVTHLGDNLTADERRSIQIAAVQQRPTPFDTDLTDRERITQVQARPVGGILSWDKPAAILLRDFDTLNKHVSLRYYQSALGIAVDTRILLPLSRVVTQLAETMEEAEARNHYLPQPLSTFDFPLYLHRIGDSDFSTLTDELYRMITQPDQHHDAATMANSYAQLSKQRDGLLATGTLLRSGVALDTCRFDLSGNNVNSIDKKLVTVEKQLSGSKNHFASWVQTMSRRISIALTLIEDLAVCDHLDRDLALENRNRLLDAYRSLVKLVPTLRLLRAHHTQLDALITAPAATHHDTLFQPTLKTIVGETTKLTNQILSQLETISFPLEHGKNGATIRDVLVERFPITGSFTDPTTVVAAQAAILADHTAVLLNRILGQLAILAQTVESNVVRRKQSRDSGSPAS